MEPLVHTPLPQLRAARALLHANGTVASHLLHAPLARSWQRCVEHGLVPDRRGRDPLQHGDRLRSALAEQHELLAHARPVIGFLHEMIRATGSLVVLADADGLLLHSVGDDSFVARAERVALQPGACWGEGVRGTNAIGTALAEGAPVVVHGDEHFLDDNGFLTCAAAPVADSCGRTIGVVDVSGEQRSRHPHTLALVRSAARMIEDSLFLARHRGHLRLHLHPHAEGLANVGQGLLALSEDGAIVGANAVARAWLGLRAGDFGSSTIAATLGLRIEDLAEDAGRSRVLDLPGNARLWGRTELPERRAAALRVVVPATATGDPRVERARACAARALASGLTVLVHGESGTGKDVFARGLHADGPRHAGPFVAVDCAAIPETLIEAELFGYVGGAFTGARREGTMGRFREADRGTLFFDEIGDMPLSLQSRLLRVLEERRVTPLGSGKPIAVDVQVIAATHRDLRAAVEQGSFRGDLYYRLAGLTVTLPPLRERADLDALCSTIVRELRPGATPRISEGLARALRAFAWPGNLRQLRSVLTAAVAMLEPGEALLDWEQVPDDVREELRGFTGNAPKLAAEHGGGADLRAVSDRIIAETVAATGHNMSEAARRLGISRNTLYRRLRRLHDRPAAE